MPSAIGEAGHITVRRKTAKERRQDSDDDEFSNTPKKSGTKASFRSKGLVKAGRRASDPKRNETNNADGGFRQSILEAYNMHKIAVGNCFDHKTVLDEVNCQLAERESMQRKTRQNAVVKFKNQFEKWFETKAFGRGHSVVIQDMAIVIDKASSIYGLRVDSLHVTATDTRYAFAKGTNVQSETGDSEAAAGIIEDGSILSPVKHQKKVTESNLDDSWRTENDDDLDNDVSLDDDDDEDRKGRRSGNGLAVDDAAEKDNRAKVGRNLSSEDDIEKFIQKLSKPREDVFGFTTKKNLLSMTGIEHDADKIKMNIVEKLENDSFMQATHVPAEGVSSSRSFLLNNAQCSSDGRVIFVHRKVIKDDAKDQVPDIANYDIVRSFRDLATNAMCVGDDYQRLNLIAAADSGHTEKALKEAMTCTIDDELTADEHEDDIVVKVRRSQDKATTGEEQPEDEATMAMDISQFPDRTLMDATVLGNTTTNPSLSQPLKKKRRKLRGRDPEEIMMDNNVCMKAVPPMEVGYEIDRLLDSKLAQNEDGSKNLKWGSHMEELAIFDDELANYVKNMETVCLDEDLRDIDSTWGAVLYRKVVSNEEALRYRREDMRNFPEGGKHKSYLLTAGEYTLFMETPQNDNLVPVDPWANEAAPQACCSRADSRAVDCDSLSVGDAWDGDDDINDIINQPAPPDAAENEMVQVMDTAPADALLDMLMGENEPDLPATDAQQLQLAAVCDDVADNLVQSTEPAPDDLVRGLGKEDAAHWKGDGPDPEITKRKERTKKAKEEVKHELLTFMPSLEEDRKEDAIHRIKVMTNNRTLVLPDDKAYLRRRFPAERRDRAPYCIETFLTPTFVFKGSYDGIRFEKSDEACLDEYEGLPHMRGDATDESSETLIKDWMNVFSRYSIFTEDDDEFDKDAASDNAEDSESEHPDNEDNEEPSTTLVVEPMDGGDMAMDDVSFDDEVDYPEETDYLNIRRLELLDKDRFDMQSSDSEEEDDPVNLIAKEDDKEAGHGMLLNKRFRIKHTRLDTCRMKAAMKVVLSNSKLDSTSMSTIVKADQAIRRKSMESVANGTSAPSEEAELEEEDDDVDTLIAGAEEGIDQLISNVLELTRVVIAPAPEVTEAEHRLNESLREEKRRQSVKGNKKNGAVDLSEFAAAVRQADFDVDGKHTFTSLFACLPHKIGKRNQREVTVPNTLNTALLMCNENHLTLDQDRPPIDDITGQNQPWMGDFCFRNDVRKEERKIADVGHQKTAARRRTQDEEDGDAMDTDLDMTNEDVEKRVRRTKTQGKSANREIRESDTPESVDSRGLVIDEDDEHM